MTVIALDSEVVASRYDPKTRTCFYTIERDGKRWTASVPLDHLETYKGNRQKRRDHVGRCLEQAMRGAPDLPAGTQRDPFRPQTAPDFAALKPGAWYVNPADGKTLQKPSAGQTSAIWRLISRNSFTR